MLTTIYKNEQGVIDKVVMTAQGVEDSKQLLQFSKNFADGSGTGRYGSHGNWTFGSDGTDYHPGSYGTGSQGQELKPFVPVEPVDDFKVGDSFRIMRADQSVDPVVHEATAISGGLVTYESDGETLEVSRDHVVKVKEL